MRKIPPLLSTSFPPMSEADEQGLLAIGGTADRKTLQRAYYDGIFPWPFDPRFLAWFSPPERAILRLSEFHVPRSLLRFRRSSSYEIHLNKNFSAVMKACASSQNRPGQNGTWITPALFPGYLSLHAAGFAHSVECYDGIELVGGLYLVAIGHSVSAESMFYTKTNASKLALCWLVEWLKNQGVTWIDVQQHTPLLARFGAVEVPRETYLELLKMERDKPALGFPTPGG